MRKIFDFSTFVELFEADSPMDSKLYDQTLGLIISTILNSYSSELAYPTSPYDSKIEADIDFIKSKSIQEKPQAFKAILDKVKASSESNSSPMAVKVVDAWVAAGSKAADALSSLVSPYKDDSEELNSINTAINGFLDDYLANLEDVAKNESLNLGQEYKINEEFSFWQGKKGIVGDLATRAAVASSKLANFKQITGMEKVIPGLENQLQQISNRIGQLEQSKRKDIDRSELEKIDDQIAAVVAQAESASLKAAKEDKTNQAAAGILVQAIGLVTVAKKLEQQYLDAKQKEEEKKKSSVVKTTISGTIDYDPDTIGKVNPEVKSFQQLVTDKFSKIKYITSLPQWKKMGTDGKFGPNTRDIVKILKAGFGLADKSGDITKELIDEIQIQADTIKESENSRIFDFRSFELLGEGAWDPTKAAEVASSLSRSTDSKTSSGSSGGKSLNVSSSAKSSVFKEGDKGNSIRAIQNALDVKDSIGDEWTNQTFGPLTKKEVIKYQEKKGLTPDGVVGKQTITKLASENLGDWTKSVLDKLLETPSSATSASGGGLLSIGSEEAWNSLSKGINDKKVLTKASKWEKSTYSGRELWRGFYPVNSDGNEYSVEIIRTLFKDGSGGDYLKSDPSKPLDNYKWTFDTKKGNIEYMPSNYTDLGKKYKIGSLSSEEAMAIAKKIKEAAEGGFGTNLNKFSNAIESINSLNLLKAVEYQLARLRSFTYMVDDSKLNDLEKKRIEEYKNNIQFYVNDEMGSDDYSTVKLIADALNKIPGVKATYTKDGDEFKEDSFKLTF